jgi:hypothetical protein
MYAGVLQTDGEFSDVIGFSLESSDVLQPSSQQLRYEHRLIGIGVDGFDATAVQDAKVCLQTTSMPTGASVLVGANRIAVNADESVNLETFEPCVGAAVQPYCGDPDVDSSTDAGIYLWKDCGVTDNWTLEAVAGGLPNVHVYDGSISASQGLTGVQSESLESTDVVTADNNQIDFLLRMVGVGADYVGFAVPETSSLCFALSLNVPGSGVYVGSGRIPKSGDFDLHTLGSCQ